ncbi:MAG: UvrD-helicase domain-containing protein, partial [Oscillospiraceae bacterium]|nr:UvrD-helicase domain-containing protein [Oscillospiraceae bacterium]
MSYEVFKGLNEEQRQAVENTEGYYRVIAGAGSGKTSALTHRYVHLTENLGVANNHILCVTFTNKSAKEMQKRIRRMVGDKDVGYICTFHGFAVQFLREDCHVVQYPKDFIVLDNEDMREIVRICFEKFGITSRQMTVEDAVVHIMLEKDTLDYVPFLIDVNMEKLNQKRESVTDLKEKILYEYLYTQRKMFGLDFQDLLNFIWHILRTDEEKRTKWQKRLEYIMIDEFQDVSFKELTIAKILSDYHKNLFIVGDPDQTIYEWRRAKVETILNFPQFFDPCTTIIMNKNYRSLSGILNPANTLVQKNKIRIEKDLLPVRENSEQSGKTVYFHAESSTGEAEWVSSQIIALCECGAKLSDIAVLYRAHYVSRPFEESFVKHEIAHTLYSGVPFYGRKEIKDVLSYLRMIVNFDDLSFERIVNVPARGIGKTRMVFLRDYAEKESCSLYEALVRNADEIQFKKTKAARFIDLVEKYRRSQLPLTDLLLSLLKDSGYEEYLRVSGEEERLDNLAELKQSIYEYESTAGEETDLHSYLQHIALFTNDDRDNRRDAVSMMTIHTAKGLEFPYVFVCGLNEGIFPSRRADTDRMLEEERRLAYVAFTRAEDKLFLSDSEGYSHVNQFRYPSRFIFDAGKENLEYAVELRED